MAKFLVPNTPDAAHIDLAEPDAGDFLALGHRATGILTGGDITALGTPGMSVSVGAATVIINGVPYSYTSATKTINPPGGTARFDLVGWDNTGPVVISGSSSTNARFPEYDPATFCLGAVVYVKPGDSAITAQYVISKGPTMEPSFRRKYAADTDVLLAADAPAGVFTVNADGKHTWGSSILARISSTVLEWTTNMRMKAADNAQSVLALYARPTDPGLQAVLDIRNSGGSSIAGFTGIGDVFAKNFTWGAGSPEGVLTRDRGCIYMDVASDVNMMYVKSTNGTNTGWLLHKAYDPTIGAVPVGSMIPWPGATGAPIPAGYVKLNGQGLNTTDYANLFAVYGYRYGGSGSTFNVPNMSGRMPIGDGGGTNLTVGQNAGAANGTIALTENELPTHAHPLSDPGHGHPQAGPYYYYVPSAFHNNRHPTPSSSLSLEHLYVDWDTVRGNVTGITCDLWGGGQAFSILPPVQAVQWIAKT